MIKTKIGSIAVILMLLVILLIVGGYFLYKIDPRIGSWIESNLGLNVPTNGSFVNPLALARDNERRESVKAISDAIFQYTSENKGLPPSDFPTSETCIGTLPECYNLKALLVPVFVDSIPKDPSTGSDENTGFTTFRNADGRIVVSIKGELGGKFEIVR